MYDNQNESLIAQLPELARLNKLRQEARELRDGELEKLMDTAIKHPDVPTPTTCVLFRRAKQLAWALGKHDKCYRPEDERSFLPWPKTFLNPHRSDGKGVNLLSTSEGDVPVFFAAQFLRARLGHLPTGHLTDDCVRTYYLVVREIYSRHHKDNPTGAAGAVGKSANSTAFVTSECARAINQVRSGMRATERLLLRVSELCSEKQAHDLCYGGEQVSLQRTHRLTLTLRAHILANVDSTFLLINDLPPDFASCVEAVTDAAIRFIEGSRLSVQTVLHELDAMPTGQLAPWADFGHRVALTALSDGNKKFDDLWRKIDPLLRDSGRVDGKTSGGLLREVVGVAQDLSNYLSERTGAHLRLIQEHLERVMYRALFLVQETNAYDSVQELLFASESYACSTGDWGHPAIAKSLKTVMKALDHDGRLPQGKPFWESPGNSQRSVVPSHAIRAIAHMLQHVPIPMESGDVDKMLRYYRNQYRRTAKAAASDGKLHIPPWHRAVAAIALHRIVEMLSANLNKAVKKNFTVKTPSFLEHCKVPRLERLMWTDVGVTAGIGEESASESVHGVLCRLGNALARSTSTTRELRTTHSVLLYGPPGTGKSTLLESLALTCDVDLVVVPPDSFLFAGVAGLEKQTAAIMDALGMLTHTVVLFDEFEVIIENRELLTSRLTKTQFDFLTNNVLPRLSTLHSQAEENRVVYAAGTNFVERMDEAAIRAKRFDSSLFVFFPDAVSRLVGLLRTYYEWCASSKQAPKDEHLRSCTIAACTVHFATTARLAALGWFNSKGWRDSEVGRFVLDNGDAPSSLIPREEYFRFPKAGVSSGLELQGRLSVLAVTALEKCARSLEATTSLDAATERFEDEIQQIRATLENVIKEARDDEENSLDQLLSIVDERRFAPRTDFFRDYQIPARLSVGWRKHEGRIVQLSDGGLRFETTKKGAVLDATKRGTSASVLYHGTEHKMRVAWAKGAQCGLQVT